jgi:hypothetical protein
VVLASAPHTPPGRPLPRGRGRVSLEVVASAAWQTYRLRARAVVFQREVVVAKG